MIDCIVSLTSHTKSRLEQLPKFLFNSLLKFNKTNFKVVLTLYKDDVQFITEDLQTLIDNDLVELIIAEENLRSHLKYFYVMQKYRDLPIITIDDDMIYPVQMFDYMLEEYHKNPSVILCRSCQQFTYTNGNINDTRKWLWNPANNIAHINHAEGYAGILYPPNCFENLDNEIPKNKVEELTAKIKTLEDEKAELKDKLLTVEREHGDYLLDNDLRITMLELGLA